MSLLDDILDTTLDDLADAPTFKPYPAGTHRCLASFATKKMGDKEAVELSFVYIENIELAEPTDVAPEQGDTASTMFQMDNDWGVGAFKGCAIPFAQALNLRSAREVVEGVQDVECIMTSSIRPDKKDPDKLYLNVKEIGVV